jgi:hypothetical protein
MWRIYFNPVPHGVSKKFAEKTFIITYSLRSNNYDVCTAAALCFLNILDVMVLEN